MMWLYVIMEFAAVSGACWVQPRGELAEYPSRTFEDFLLLPWRDLGAFSRISMKAITSGEGLIATVWTASCVTGSGCFMFDRESVKIRKARESRLPIAKVQVHWFGRCDHQRKLGPHHARV